MLRIHWIMSGFWPAQLVFGQNPSLPMIMNAKPPALENSSVEVVAESVGYQEYQRGFVKDESSWKIKRALRHNIRPAGNNKFFTGDLVYYKRGDSRRWKGPGRVIGSESYNVLIKHRVRLEKKVDSWHAMPVRGTQSLKEFLSDLDHRVSKCASSENETEVM